MDKGETIVQKSSPWQTPALSPPPCSLLSVMDEELARELQKTEDSALVVELPEPAIPEVIDGGQDDTSNDLLLAQMLQMQFDAEHDDQLKAEERRCNGSSKVTVSLDNYRYLHPLNDDSSSSDDDIDYDEEVIAAAKTASGGKGITTKHDAGTCGRKNTNNMQLFPPGFASGDVDSETRDLKLSNVVYNTLKQHSIREEKQSHRLHEKKEHSTHEQALDSRTRLMLYKLVNGEILESVSGCISTGKEACVFHAFGGKGEEKPIPNECAIKVFKTTLNEFRTRERYINDDHRFRDRMNKQNPRKTIKLWAEKEMRNLTRMHKAGIPCPEVVLLRKHILVMSFIGEAQNPAPKLKDAKLTSNQFKMAYDQCVAMMCTMYQQCHLIHADLSEYNMLWHDNQVWYIDVSQSVEPIHAHSLEFLYRDCHNVVKFFTARGVPKVLTVHELFNKVSQLNVPFKRDEEFLDTVKTFEKDLRGEKTKGDAVEPYDFEYFFKKTSHGPGRKVDIVEDM